MNKFKVGDEVIITNKALSKSLHGNYGDVYIIESVHGGVYISESSNKVSLEYELELFKIWDSPLMKALS